MTVDLGDFYKDDIITMKKWYDMMFANGKIASSPVDTMLYWKLNVMINDMVKDIEEEKVEKDDQSET